MRLVSLVATGTKPRRARRADDVFSRHNISPMAAATMASAPSSSWKSRFGSRRNLSKDQSATSQKSDELLVEAETSMSSSQHASKVKKSIRGRLRQLLPSTSQTRLSGYDASPLGEEGPEVKSQSPQESPVTKSSSDSSGDVANENRAHHTTVSSLCAHTHACAT